MNRLRRIDDWIGRLLEGRLGRWLGAQLEPHDIARRIGDHMEDHRVIGAGRRYAPNRFTVFLAPDTLERLEGMHRALERDLAEFVREHAARSGDLLLGAPRVRCVPDTSLDGGRFRIDGRLADLEGGRSQDSDGRTMALDLPGPDGRTAEHLRLVGDGRCFDLPTASPHPIRVGRALDNDMILRGATVSRHHARFVRRSGHWAIEDTESRHGVFINERQVDVGLIRGGDRIRLGRSALRVERVPSGDGADGADRTT